MAGGAGWAGAPAALLRSVRRLREVFEVCGRDPDGFLRVERVAALGLRFGQGEEVRSSGASPGRGNRRDPAQSHSGPLCGSQGMPAVAGRPTCRSPWSVSNPP